MRELTIRYGTGRCGIEGTARLCGRDLVVSFTGGDAGHVGAASLALYEPMRNSATVSTLAVPTHRDDRLSAQGAKFLSRTFGCTVVVTVGIHIDDATEQDIGKLCTNFDHCLRELANSIASALQEP